MRNVRIVSLAALTFVSCSAVAQTPAEMAPYGAALGKVARAVDAAANNPNFNSLDGDELLLASVRHDISLLIPFSTFKLRARRASGASAVLMCDASERQALLEDSGCTIQLDLHRYKQADACDFALSLEQICR